MREVGFVTGFVAGFVAGLWLVCDWFVTGDARTLLLAENSYILYRAKQST